MVIDKNREEIKDHLYCVNCGVKASSLYRQFSKDIIRLTPCECCGLSVDKYVEYDPVLIVIHLILLYLPAYRHFVHNTRYKIYHRLAFLFLLCMSFDRWNQQERSGSESVLDLEYGFYESFFLSLLEMSLYLLLVVLSSYLNGFHKREQIILTINSAILGYFGCVATVVTIVYGLRNTLYYRILTLLFLYASQIQINRALFPSRSIIYNIFLVVISKSISLIIPMFIR